MNKIIQIMVNARLGRISDHVVSENEYARMKNAFYALLRDMHKFDNGRTFTTEDLINYARQSDLQINLEDFECCFCGEKYSPSMFSSCPCCNSV